MPRQDQWSKGLLLGLYVGLSLLFPLSHLDAGPDGVWGSGRDTVLDKATNVYGLLALAGAALGLWRVLKWADKPRATPAVAAVWVCAGLAVWVLGQGLWTWWVLTRTQENYPSPADPFFIVSDVIWLLVLLKTYQSLRRRGMAEISQYWPVLTVLLGVLATASKWLFTESSGATPTKLIYDYIYIFVTFTSAFLTLPLVFGKNEEIPLPVKQFINWLSAAAVINAVAVFAFTVTDTLPEDNPYAYYNGNWVDWLLLTAMGCWGMAALKCPVRQEELQYTFGTTKSGMTEADVYLAGEIAESCCKGAAETERVAAYVNSIRWVLDAAPSCWRVVKLGDEVVGSTFLFPAPRHLMESFNKGELKEHELFEKVKKSPLVWDCLYLADASILARHRRRGLAFKAFKTTIENIAKEHPQIEVHCRPITPERKKLAEKIEAHFAGRVVVKTGD
ncbi:MAG TPA: hypothetical protein VN282_10460 [Pyrinomonadaceae bacterium]|nr:hypothetical protein [Pyrinomonadaceae bacterium]